MAKIVLAATIIAIKLLKYYLIRNIDSFSRFNKISL